MMTRKTIVVPCIVNSWLNVSAETAPMFGRINWYRIRTASTPPTRKKKSAVWRYSVPIFLWSTVVSQYMMPVRGAPVVPA